MGGGERGFSFVAGGGSLKVSSQHEFFGVQYSNT